MPTNVIRFQVGAYLGLLLGGLVLLIADRPADVSPVAGALLTAAIWALAAWLIYSAAEQAKNWARWTYGILVVFSAMAVGFEAGSRGASDPLYTAVSIASSALELWAVYCAFTGDAVAWFDPQQA